MNAEELYYIWQRSKLFILATHTQYNSTASSSYKADGRNFYQQYGKGSAGGKIQNSKFYFILQKYVQTIESVVIGKTKQLLKFSHFLKIGFFSIDTFYVGNIVVKNQVFAEATLVSADFAAPIQKYAGILGMDWRTGTPLPSGVVPVCFY